MWTNVDCTKLMLGFNFEIFHAGFEKFTKKHDFRVFGDSHYQCYQFTAVISPKTPNISCCVYFNLYFLLKLNQRFEKPKTGYVERINMSYTL